MENRKIVRNVVRRWDGNPVIALGDIPFAASDVYNAGAVRFGGEYILLVTVESLRGDCAIYRARSEDGRRFEMDPRPVLTAALDGPFAEYESEGVRDARITPFEDTYYIVYLAQSPHGVRLALAQTEDFESFRRVALISEPDTKNGVLFPVKFGGRFARLERPREGGNIWISFSRDLLHWGGWRILMAPRHGYWDYHRIGAAVPPIETECGWMVFYYGVKEVPGGPVFRLGTAFLDRDDPTVVLGRTNMPVLAPRERYERIGDVANLVFSCGAVLSEDRQTVELYYGAADSCICLGTVPLAELERMCNKERAREGS